jgi:hypothetical protein
MALRAGHNREAALLFDLDALLADDLAPFGGFDPVVGDEFVG